MSIISAILARLTAWWQAYYGWYYEYGLGPHPKLHMTLALLVLAVGVFIAYGLYVLFYNVAIAPIVMSNKRRRNRQFVEHLIAAANNPPASPRTAPPVRPLRAAWPEPSPTAMPPQSNRLAWPPEPEQSAMPTPTWGRHRPTKEGKPAERWAARVGGTPTPPADGASDREVWRSLDDLVVWFRGQAVQKHIAPNAQRPGKGAVILGLRDDREVDHVPFATIPATAPGWSSQPNPELCGRMEAYITDDAWEVVSWYPTFTVDGRVSYNPWHITSAASVRSAMSMHPMLRHSLGVSTKEAYDFVWQLVDELLNRQY